jgi:chromosome segregation ATPase
MDNYLRAAILRWFGGSKGVKIPANPIYIFDGATAPNTKLHISVLNRGAFRPLRTQFGWLNENLVVTREIGAEKLIREMAANVTWQDLSRRIKTQAHTVEKEFKTQAQTTSKKISASFDELIQVVTREIENLTQETFKIVKQIKELNERIERLIATRTETAEELEQTQEQMRRTGKRRAAVGKDIADLERKVTTVQRRCDRLYAQAETEINRLKLTRDRLEQEVKNLSKGGS